MKKPSSSLKLGQRYQKDSRKITVSPSFIIHPNFENNGADGALGFTAAGISMASA
jgi:hypothetical protein